MYLWLVYADTRLGIPDPSQGRVYSLTTYGRVVYLTWAEEVRLSLLIGAGLVLGGCAIGIHLNLAKKDR